MDSDVLRGAAGFFIEMPFCILASDLPAMSALIAFAPANEKAPLTFYSARAFIMLEIEELWPAHE
ncbi:MAG TPA: hypothetical protein V6C81_10025 [Planktothrix sp.]